MSYRIDYEPHKDKYYPAYKPRKKLPGVTIGSVLCVIVLFGLFLQNKTFVRKAYNDSLQRLCIWVQEETQIGQRTTEFASKLIDYENP